MVCCGAVWCRRIAAMEPAATRATRTENIEPCPVRERKQLGEVISTSYSSFTVESYELNNTPPLGGLVVAENQGRNQRGEIVFLITTQVLAERRI